MDEVARCRRAARDAVADVEPARLREIIDDRLADGPMAPGTFALLCSRATDEDVPLDNVAEHAAGVQLIYDGLRLTRTLSHDEPWSDAANEYLPADVEILAADVLVARGFYLLARTAAANQAVETIRAFGRDQTDCQTGAGDPDILDRELEADVLDLAAVAGVTAAGGDPDALRAVATDLAGSVTAPFPPAPAFLPDAVTLRSRIAPPVDPGGDESATTSATDP
jgi:hypothetical protein